METEFTMACDYSWQWAELRRVHKRFRRAVLAAVAVLGLTFVTEFEPREISRVTALALLVAWICFVLKIFKVYSEHTYWLCPRCGEQSRSKSHFKRTTRESLDGRQLGS
jgi:hypothetical protein